MASVLCIPCMSERPPADRKQVAGAGRQAKRCMAGMVLMWLYRLLS